MSCRRSQSPEPKIQSPEQWHRGCLGQYGRKSHRRNPSLPLATGDRLFESHTVRATVEDMAGIERSSSENSYCSLGRWGSKTQTEDSFHYELDDLIKTRILCQ